MTYDDGCINTTVIKYCQAIIRQLVDCAGRCAACTFSDTTLIEPDDAEMFCKCRDTGIPEICCATQTADEQKNRPCAIGEYPNRGAIGE